MSDVEGTPPAKKLKMSKLAIEGSSSDAPDPSSSPKKEKKKSKSKKEKRLKFDKTRVQLVYGDSDYKNIEQSGVAYFMQRDNRVDDNWAFIYAQQLAIKHDCPLFVVSHIQLSYPENAEATERTLDFKIKGLQAVAESCAEKGINFALLGFDTEKSEQDKSKASEELLLDFVKSHDISTVVFDLNPLRYYKNQVKNYVKLAKKTKATKDSTVLIVDAHNIVPLWVASEKREYAARTIRPKIMGKLNTYLTEFIKIEKMEDQDLKIKKYSTKDWTAYKKTFDKIDDSVKPVAWAKPGPAAGNAMLQAFLTKRLGGFNTNRNNPNKDGCSNLSPWFHHGQLSVQRAILEVKNYKKGSYAADKEAYIEEAVVRRELSDNCCYYSDFYDTLETGYEWAKQTLKDHEKDKRDFIYTRQQFANGQTHDHLWNAAQIQMVTEGKMQGYIRMYWAKKILEWSETPAKALATALYLNDHFSLDGADPNGFVGCTWSIVGIHDRGWTERPIFGKIRFMNYAGCKRKFDVPMYERKYSSLPSDMKKKQGTIEAFFKKKDTKSSKA